MTARTTMLDESQRAVSGVTLPAVEHRGTNGALPTHNGQQSDAELAGTLARIAGQRLLELRALSEDQSVDELKRRGDAEAQRVLAAGLAAARPGDAVLSEEDKDD